MSKSFLLPQTETSGFAEILPFPVLAIPKVEFPKVVLIVFTKLTRAEIGMINSYMWKILI